MSSRIPCQVCQVVKADNKVVPMKGNNTRVDNKVMFTLYLKKKKKVMFTIGHDMKQLKFVNRVYERK